MQVLWLAIFLYSVGLAVLLHFRPALMFNENGSWKEFGYHRDSRHTLFPVWLFAVVWAFVSYAIASVAGTFLDSGVIAAATASAPLFSSAVAESDEEEEQEEEEEEIAVPVSRVRSRSKPKSEKKPRAGYYVLDPEQKEESGLRRYIYYGPDRPEA